MLRGSLVAVASKGSKKKWHKIYLMDITYIASDAFSKVQDYSGGNVIKPFRAVSYAFS
jgi:hypothetical protein